MSQFVRHWPWNTELKATPDLEGLANVWLEVVLLSQKLRNRHL